MLSSIISAARSIRRRPWQAALVVATLSVALLSNLAVFSVMEATLLRPSSIFAYDRLGFVFSMRQDFDPFGANLRQYERYSRDSRLVERFGLAQELTVNIGEGVAIRPHRAGAVFTSYFEALGVNPIQGRVFSHAEEYTDEGRPVIISHKFWQAHFLSRTDVLGKTVRVDGQLRTVIGVMPIEMELPRDASIWVPLGFDPATRSDQQRENRGYQLVARLRPGVAHEEADVELRRINLALRADEPRIFEGWGVKLYPLRQQMIGDIAGRVYPVLFGLQCGVALLLVVAIFNLSSLALARSLLRAPEFAVRRALGATTENIRHLLYAEQTLLAMASWGMAIVLFLWLLPMLRSWQPIDVYAQAGVFTSYRLTPTAAVVALFVSLAAAWASASLASRPIGSKGFALHLRTGTRSLNSGNRRSFRALIIGQVALAAVLASGAGLMLATLAHLRRINLGFDPANVHVWRLALPSSRYDAHQAKINLAENLLREVRALPGVSSADISTNYPLEAGSSDTSFLAEGSTLQNASEVPIAAIRLVTEDYPKTLGLSLISGRFIADSDRPDSMPVAVVCETLARHAFPGVDPIGRRLSVGNPRSTNTVLRTIIGVVRPVKEDWFNYRIDRPVIYVPYYQQNATRNGAPRLSIRCSSSLSDLDASLRGIIARYDADVASVAPIALSDHLQRVIKTEVSAAALAGLLAAISVSLSAAGLFGVVSLLNAGRTREFGVRLALGETPGGLLRNVLKEGVLLAVAGSIIGLLVAFGAAQWAESLVYGINPRAPALYIAVAILMLGVSLFACWLPARRAARVDPLIALRSE